MNVSFEKPRRRLHGVHGHPDAQREGFALPVFGRSGARRAGFTLVEVIVTFVIVIMVIGLSGTFLLTGSNFLSRTETNASDKALAEKAADFVKDRLLYATEVKVVTAGALGDAWTIPTQGALLGSEILFIGEVDSSSGKVVPSHTGRLYYQRGDDAAPVDVFGETLYRDNLLALSYKTTVTDAAIGSGGASSKVAVFDVSANVVREDEQTQSASQIFRMYNIGKHSEPLTDSAIKSWDAEAGEDTALNQKFYLRITPPTDNYAATSDLIAQFDAIKSPPTLTGGNNYVWKDITGNGNNMTLTFTNNSGSNTEPIRVRSIYFDGNGDGGIISNLDLSRSSEVTVEVCFREANTSAHGMLFEHSANAWHYDTAPAGSFGLVINSAFGAVWTGGINTSIVRLEAARGAARIRNYSWTNQSASFTTHSNYFGLIANKELRKVWIDGSPLGALLQAETDETNYQPSLPMTEFNTSGKFSKQNFYLARRASVTNYFFEGEIAAVRIYDKKLNDDEAARNAWLDKQRFDF
jgi:type II secretory pathway pseudopilin PulG